MAKLSDLEYLPLERVLLQQGVMQTQQMVRIRIPMNILLLRMVLLMVPMMLIQQLDKDIKMELME